MPMRKGDWIIIILAILLAVLPLLTLLPTSGQPAQAIVRRDGDIIRTLPLNFDCTVEFSDESGVNVVQVENGAVRITHADCPDQTCVRQGAIDRTNETLVCLPHRLTIEITGAASDVDAVTQ